MSKSNVPNNGGTSSVPNFLPIIVSVVVIFLVLGLIFGLLLSRPSPQQLAQQQQTQVALQMEELATAIEDGQASGDDLSQSGQEPAAIPSEQLAKADKYSEAPAMTIDVSKEYIATITTPRGDIVIKLRPDLAPETVNSFVFLSREGYYDGVTWHRVLPGFMAQGGDPTGTGMGGPGYTVKGEFTNEVSFDRPGLVAMARPGNDVDGNGSQFFITTAPATYLDGQYTIFGEVIEGQDIVDGIPLRDPDSATELGEEMLSVTISEN
jgi:peptidylprolyl isomerase